MAWDWDKLKQKQQGPGGGVPPGVDEVVQKLRKVKLPQLRRKIKLLKLHNSNFVNNLLSSWRETINRKGATNEQSGISR